VDRLSSQLVWECLQSCRRSPTRIQPPSLSIGILPGRAHCVSRQAAIRWIKVTPLNDKDKDGANFLIKEIDPFTFLGSFNRQTCLDERLSILAEFKKLLDAFGALPEDFNGIPVHNNQQSWFIPIKRNADATMLPPCGTCSVWRRTYGEQR